DLDGDGRADLVLAVAAERRRFERSLRIHRARADGSHAQRPDVEVPLPPTVSACAIGDVHPDPGTELIWFGARGAYAWLGTRPQAQRVVKLVAAEFLFQMPLADDVVSWQDGVRDVDGDGLVDLVLPEPDGYCIALQRRPPTGGVSFSVQRLKLPERDEPLRIRSPRRGSARRGAPVRGRREPRGFSLSISVSGMPRTAEPLVDVDEHVPAPQLVDWDGDRDLDIVAKSGSSVSVWLQGPAGTFSSAPNHTFAFPLTDEQTQLDPSFSSWLADLDGDRRSDAVLLCKAQGGSEIRTQVMVFRQRPNTDRPLFDGGTPAQLLVLGGFTAAPRLSDIDGDGSPDLTVAAWRLDALDQLRSGGTSAIDVELYVFNNRRGRFSRTPDLTYTTSVQGEALRSGDKLFARFVGDLNGDRVRELLVRDRPERVRLMLVRRQGEALQVHGRPLYEMALDPGATLRVLEDPADRPGFLVLEPTQVLLVTF
ncbi:MAG: VCBS repeat-containing protein, partial [Planctomycetes bacterium]|nr:VCBS repeat-containing protein [Planctomycetota bacterium]